MLAEIPIYRKQEDCTIRKLIISSFQCYVSERGKKLFAKQKGTISDIYKLHWKYGNFHTRRNCKFPTFYDNKNSQPGKGTGHLFKNYMVTPIDQREQLVQDIDWPDYSFNVNDSWYSWIFIHGSGGRKKRQDLSRPQSYAGGF